MEGQLRFWQEELPSFVVCLLSRCATRMHACQLWHAVAALVYAKLD